MGGNTGPELDVLGVARLLKVNFPSSSPECLDLILRSCVVIVFLSNQSPMVPQT